jgi:DNA-binding CsgD family transcriptional regulator
VWREGARLAETEGFRVITCRPAESEAKLSFSALADLVESLAGESLERLPEPQRIALEVVLLKRSPSGPAPDARAVGAGFRSMLDRAAAKEPLVVAIDDAQWLDTASLGAIEFALRRTTGPIGLLATRRPSSALDAALRGSQPHRLGPMTLGALHHVVVNELGSSLARPLLSRVHETAQGNPFFALQIARLALELSIGPTAPLPVPKDLSELVLGRVERLDAGTHDVLCTAAASGSPSRGLLARVHGDIGEALDEAEQAGILESGDKIVRFAHPLYSAAVYASIGHERRRRVHARLVAAVDEPEEQARHLALAATPPDEETAKRVHGAAKNVAARGAHAAAAELVEQAIHLGDPASDATDERLADFGEYLFQSGNSVRARDMFRQVKSWPTLPKDRQIEGLWTMIDTVYWTTGGHDSAALGEELLQVVDDVEVKAALHGKIASGLEFDMARGLEHAEAALALLEPLGDAARPDLVGLALGMQARNRLALGLGLDRDAIERAIVLGSGGYVARSYGQWLKYVDDFDGARHWLERSRRDYEEKGEDVSIPNVLQQLAMTECWAGNLGRAAEHAARACELADEMEITAVGPYRVRSIVEAHRGNEAEVRAIAERLYGEGWAPGIIQHLEIGLGLLEHSLGNHEAADRHLRRALELAEQMGQLEPGVHRVHGDAAEVAIALGDTARAREIAEFLEEHGRRTDHRWSAAVAARTKALLHAAEGDFDAALSAVEDALTTHERLPMPYELARTLLVKGQIERRARHRREARDSLKRARETFEEIGAKLWAARAANELKRIPIRRGASDELTEGEGRVAELVASGLTNKEVAQALFISPKTVEANLSRIYGKLGIHSRAELGARMAERAKM